MKYKEKYFKILSDLEIIANEIRAEIQRMQPHPGIGKYGCLKRINVIIQSNKKQE